MRSEDTSRRKFKIIISPSILAKEYELDPDALAHIQTLVSSCIYVHNMNPSVFPSPQEFQPERWLDGDPVLDQHLCSFSRGSRSCLGQKYVLISLNILSIYPDLLLMIYFVNLLIG